MVKVRLYRNRNWLYQKYSVGGFSSDEISRLCDITVPAVCYWLHKFDIETRGATANKGRPSWNAGLTAADDSRILAGFRSPTWRRQHSEKEKEIRSQKQKRNWEDPVYYKMQLQGFKRARSTLEYREKRSRTQKVVWQNEEYRKIQSNSHTGKFGPLASNWQGGISNLPYAFDFNDELKAEIRKRDK